MILMRSIFTFVLLLFSASLFSQKDTSAVTKTSESKRIEILNANDLIYEESSGIKAKRLVGDVILKHENSLMYCDSAHVVNASNSMKAYSNVRIEEGDSIEVFGDYLEYDGNTKLAVISGEVELKQDDMRLLTDAMTYDRNANYGFYLNGGVLLTNEGKDTLWSKKGYYFSNIKEARFRDSVRLNATGYRIESDTLHYRTDLERSLFFGPTTIYSGEDIIYCEAGWSSNKTQESEFRKNAVIYSEDQELRGDTIFFDNEEKIGEARGHILIRDTTQDYMVQGGRAWHFSDDSISIVTDFPMLSQFEGDDTLYLHGDTLRTFYDTSKQQVILAFQHVKLYKSDMQGMCDSLAFHDADSSIKMFIDPIIWSDNNQITGEYIQINRVEGKVESMDIEQNALIVSESDSSRYDQISGTRMKAFFRENELKKVDVFEKGKTIYYATENDTNVIGLNYSSCDDRIVILMDSSKVDEIIFYQKPTSVLYPEEQWTQTNMFMPNFVWYDAYRPREKQDILKKEQVRQATTESGTSEADPLIEESSENSPTPTEE